MRLSRVSQILLVAAAISVSGCGGNNVGLQPVQGTVLLDGKPLVGAVVVFQPENGPPSKAITDANGKYTMQYNVKSTGALLGLQKVWLEEVPGDARKEVAENIGTQPARIPPKFKKSFETVEVVKGDNTFDFDLKSGG